MVCMEMEERARRAVAVTRLGVWVNIGLFLVKLAAGVFGRSAAMIADAIHTLSDFATDVAVLVGIRYARRPPDKDHDYGHGTYETLAAAFVGLLLFAVALKIGGDAIRQIFQAISGVELTQPKGVAFWAAILSVAVNEFVFRRTIAVGRLIESDAVIANAWHHRSDAFSSVGTALGIGAAVFLGKRWCVMDPIAALLASVLLLKVSFEILHEQLLNLTERSLSDEVEKEIETLALSIPEFSNPHNLRTHKVGALVVIDIHVRVNPEMSVREAHHAATLLEEKLCARFGDSTVTNIHVEPWKEGGASRQLRSGEAEKRGG